jgi:hypothetical protein
MRNYIKDPPSDDIQIPISGDIKRFANPVLAFLSSISGGNLSSSAAVVADKTDVLQPRIIGYRGHVCKRCLSTDSLAIICVPEANTKIFETEHICNEEHYRRTKSNGAYLVSAKLNPNFIPEGHVNLSPSYNQHDWTTRAITKCYTVLNDNELFDFLLLTRSRTFNCFCISSFDEQEIQPQAYAMFINNEPLLPFEI